MKRWIFILAITFSVVQISDGIFGRSRSWNVPTRAPDPFGSPDWCYCRKPFGQSDEYDELTTTPDPFLDNGWGRKPSGFPKIELSCFGGGGGSSSSENDVEHGGRRCKPKKHKSKKPKKPKDRHKKHKKHHGNKNDPDLWAPRPPVGYEAPNTNDIWE